MFSEELISLLIKVVKSWQVIAMVVALVLYMSMVNYVLRSHHKPASVSRTKPKKEKVKKEKPKKGKPGSAESGDEDEITEQE
jgi:hypothetical protein